MDHKKTQYGADVVMFLHNKIIIKKKFELFAKKCWPFKQPMVLLYMVRRIGHMVLKPCARPPKNTHGFIVHGLGGPCK